MVQGFTGISLADLSRGVKVGALGGLLLILGAVDSGSWVAGFVGLAVLLGSAWFGYAQIQAKAAEASGEPWPWPADFRALAEGMARPIDPTPKRVVPAHEKAAEIAHVATSQRALDRLVAEKPPAWSWAAFTSVLVQRRNALQARLRAVAGGYQVPLGADRMSAREYATVAHDAASAIVDIGSQAEKFMLSPAFTGAFGNLIDDIGPDADAVLSTAHRLMDYHAAFLEQAEIVLQTPVEGEAMTFVGDMGAFAISPLVGYDKMILEMCDRIGQAQELIPYANGGVIQLDDVRVDITMQDGLMKKVLAHFARFTDSVGE